MHKRKILFCITLAKQGGAQSFLLKLATYLQNQGHKITIVAGEGSWLRQQCEERNLQFTRIPSLQREINPLADWRATKELTRLFIKEKPDAVHLNSTKMGILGSIAAKKANISNVVYRIGGWVFLEKLPTWKKWLYKTLEIKTAKWKDTIICVHPEDAKLAKRLGIKPKRQVLGIPNGIDFEAFHKTLLSREEARKELNIAEDKIIFGTIANFFPPKNLPNYIEACALVTNKLPQAQFLILGDGMERKRIEEERKRYGLKDNVLLPGSKNQASKYLKAFDVFVLPSSKEGMSFALLEAMAAGLPCVATDVGAASFMFENEKCGWISSPNNMSELAGKMIQATQSYPDNIKGRCAKKKAEKDFPLEKNLKANQDALFC